MALSRGREGGRTGAGAEPGLLIHSFVGARTTSPNGEVEKRVGRDGKVRRLPKCLLWETLSPSSIRRLLYPFPRPSQAAVFGRRVGESRCAKVVLRMVFFY